LPLCPPCEIAMREILDAIILPREMTQFERSYLERMNRVALWFFAAHLPVFVIIAWVNRTEPFIAALLTGAVLAGPALAVFTFKNPRAVSVVHGIAAMFFGGLLVHLGQGPVQIEMHFYFFALIAMSAVFGNPLVIIAAAITVTLHHLVVWLVIPASVFNYQAEWWVVAVHAAFVVLESVATCYIARSFFDNVIGLEKVVEARTQALDTRNSDMRVLLDNVLEGFTTIDREGVLAVERSAALDRWFGTPLPQTSWFDHLGRTCPDFGARSHLNWAEVSSDILPVELTLEQMPKRLTVGARHLQVAYRPIGSEPHQRFLVVVTDETSEVEREQAELERREAMAVFERVLVDRAGFEIFFEEASNIVSSLMDEKVTDLTLIKRLLHTLKGNAGISGLNSVSDLCHDLESVILENDRLPERTRYEALANRWARLAIDVERLLGTKRKVIEIDDGQYAALEAAVITGEETPVLLKRVRALRLEPTARRLHHFAEQARRIAHRLDKSDIQISVEDNGVRLDGNRWNGFWSTFVHAVRNALDHGIETPDVRMEAGKSPGGSLALRTVENADSLIVEIEDDGRGIDWVSIAAKAQRLGLPAATLDDLQKALFVDGLSTAENVTDLSGRGIGMGALLHGTALLGGKLTIETKKGEGTKFRMVFPISKLLGSSPPRA
jgi:two-component system chemotaxis sensor kinase CheA